MASLEYDIGRTIAITKKMMDIVEGVDPEDPRYKDVFDKVPEYQKEAYIVAIKRITSETFTLKGRDKGLALRHIAIDCGLAPEGKSSLDEGLFHNLVDRSGALTTILEQQFNLKQNLFGRPPKRFGRGSRNQRH